MGPAEWKWASECFRSKESTPNRNLNTTEITRALVLWEFFRNSEVFQMAGRGKPLFVDPSQNGSEETKIYPQALNAA